MKEVVEGVVREPGGVFSISLDQNLSWKDKDLSHREGGSQNLRKSLFSCISDAHPISVPDSRTKIAQLVFRCY